MRRRLGRVALPPHVAVIGERDVGEQRVAAVDRPHGVGVGLPAGARCDTEESLLRVHRVKPAVLAEPHPRDVVAQRLDLPAGDGRIEHGEIRLAASGREGGRDEVHASPRRGELEDEHVLGQPALVPRYHAGNAQRVALLAQQRVAAVAGPEAPDRPLLGELADVLLVVARPRHVRLPGLERRTDRVQAGDERGVRAHPVEHRGAHPGHDPHRGDDVGGVGHLHAEHRLGGVERAHAERDDVHGPATHAAVVQLGHPLLHLGRRQPVVGGAGVGRVGRADERALLDAGDIGRIGVRQERVGFLRRIKAYQRAGLDELVGQAAPLLLRPVTPDHPIGTGQVGHLAHPGEQRLVGGRRVFEAGDCGLDCHRIVSSGWSTTPRPRPRPRGQMTQTRARRVDGCLTEFRQTNAPQGTRDVSRSVRTHTGIDSDDADGRYKHTRSDIGIDSTVHVRVIRRKPRVS